MNGSSAVGVYAGRREPRPHDFVGCWFWYLNFELWKVLGNLDFFTGGAYFYVHAASLMVSFVNSRSKLVP